MKTRAVLGLLSYRYDSRASDTMRRPGFTTTTIGTTNPSIGRYVESDPIGLLGGLNTYDYTGQGPLGASDELGLFVGNEVATGMSQRKARARSIPEWSLGSTGIFGRAARLEAALLCAHAAKTGLAERSCAKSTL